MDAQVPRPERHPFVAEAPRFADGSATPRDFLEEGLAIAARIEGDVQAFAFLDVEGARRQADESTARWRAGRPLSPVDGMPVGIKDVIETRDMPTGMGSPLFAGWRSGRDAACVAALREAGAIIVGKTVTTEFAAVVPGPTRNPWDLDRTPGGSSSGSAAAVGAGILSGALGTQVVGSIIRPAGYCGCVGFKPTVGSLNRGGIHDFNSQSCLGTLGATLADAWAVAQAIVRRAGGDPGQRPLGGAEALPEAVRPRRVALLETPGWPVATAGARAAFAEVRRRLEAAGVAVFTGADSPRLEALEAALGEGRALTQVVNQWETRWPLNTYAWRDRSKLSQAMIDRLAASEAMTVDDYVAGLARRDALRALHAALAPECDACVTLSAPSAAPLGLGSTGDPAFAVPASVLGTPALTLPLLVDDGLPLGLQVIGFAHRDAELAALARWCEGLWADA